MALIFRKSLICLYHLMVQFLLLQVKMDTLNFGRLLGRKKMVNNQSEICHSNYVRRLRKKHQFAWHPLVPCLNYRCLHDFSPHKGAPVSQLIFCDNRQSLDPGNQYWRFLITAAKSNTEIKIWCTVNWKCLQTLRYYYN